MTATRPAPIAGPKSYRLREIEALESIAKALAFIADALAPDLAETVHYAPPRQRLDDPLPHPETY